VVTDINSTRMMRTEREEDKEFEEYHLLVYDAV
jgi:hypothetical protein